MTLSNQKKGGASQLQALEGILLRLTLFPQYANKYILRGSLMMRQWQPDRPVKDIDFYISDTELKDIDTNRVRSEIFEILSVDAPDDLIIVKTEGTDLVNMEVTETWYEKDTGTYKGVQILFNVIHLIDKWQSPVLIDVGLDDPLATNNPWMDYKTLDGKLLKIRSSPPVVALAWKLQLLVHGNWRAKDVADCYILVKSMRKEWESEELKATVKRIFAFRNQPLTNLKLLLELKMGLSRQAKRKWKKYFSEIPVKFRSFLPNDVFEAITEIAKILLPEIRDIVWVQL